MNMMHSSEISLRSAVFSAQKSLEKGENLADKIKQQALNQLSVVQQAEGLFSGVKNSNNLQSAAIHLAVQGIELAYHAVSAELSEAKFKRKRFVEECETHLASFSISSHREMNEYSLEELSIYYFIQLIDSKFSDIKPYLGIISHQSQEFPDERYYAVMPFYRMSMSLEQNSVIASKIDTHRQAIFLFLKTALPLKFYYEKYQNYSRFWLQIQGLAHQKNYLNHLKAPRFIISALANLIWNLQHPVDANSGVPLPIDECSAICNKASMFLNDLLNPSQFKYLPQLDQRCEKVIRNLCQIELLIKSLQSAYDYDHLHEINLSDISKHMHSALRIMSNKIMELIYRDENASEKLVGQIMIMGELLMQNHELYEAFHELQKKCKPKFINEQASTLIDILNLFAHQTPWQRKQVWQSLIQTGSEYHIQFAHQLKLFHKTFLDQFETVVKKNLKRQSFNENTAPHFIPLILMVMESFTVFRDTRPKKSTELESLDDKDESVADLQNSTHDRKQRHKILNDAASTTMENPNKYYYWSLSSFMEVKSAFHDSLDMLLSKQNQMRIKTLEMDILAFRLSENRSLLLKKDFKRELLRALKDICVYYNQLLKMFNLLESRMQADLTLQRDQKRILQPMLDDLESCMEAIQKSIAMVNTIMTDARFEEYERSRQKEKVGISLLSTNMPNRIQSTHEISDETSSRISEYEYIPTPKPRRFFNTANIESNSVNPVTWCLGMTSLIFLCDIFFPVMKLSLLLNTFLALLCLSSAFILYFNKSSTLSIQNLFHQHSL